MTIIYLSLVEAGRKEGSMLVECTFFLVKEDRASRISLNKDSSFSLLSVSNFLYWLSEIFTKGRSILSRSSFTDLEQHPLGTKTGLMLMLTKV